MIFAETQCGHRNCAIRKLIVFIKMVSERHAEIGMSEDDLLKVGLGSIAALGVTQEELALATIDLVFDVASSPLMRDINDDSPVASGE